MMHEASYYIYYRFPDIIDMKKYQDCVQIFEFEFEFVFKFEFEFVFKFEF